jgi:hypothetical protein
MTTDIATIHVESTSDDSRFRIPSGYERWVRFGANWTIVISPYLILYTIMVFVLGGGGDDTNNFANLLDTVGHSPIPFIAVVFLDGLFHALAFITFLTLFTVLRVAFPVQASLILLCGVWQMLMGFTKGLIASYVFPRLGMIYLTAEPTLRSALIPVASAMDGLRMGMQWMDSFGVMFGWILVSLLPKSSNLPRPIRWLGWIMAFGILVPEWIFPGFLFVILLSPPWLFLLGRWMKGLALRSGLIQEMRGVNL